MQTNAVRTRQESSCEEDVFLFTDDPILLQQYYYLYTQECRINDTPACKVAEQEFNRKSHIVVVRRGDLCIGGARLTISHPQNRQKMPVEIEDFSLNAHFPQIEQNQLAYSEVSRLAVLPGFRSGDFTLNIIRLLLAKAAACGVDLIFVAAPLLNLRAYMQSLTAMGAKSKVHFDIEIPPYPGFEDIKDYLLSCDIKHSGN